MSTLRTCIALAAPSDDENGPAKNALEAAVGACERIQRTPPYADCVLLHRTVYLNCLLLPFGLVDAIGVATLLITVFVSYIFSALKTIAHSIDDPFGNAPNSLTLSALTRTTERSLLASWGAPLPPR
ncbi:MAG: bestrophin family ion channel [Sphingomonadaceae bacterium]